MSAGVDQRNKGQSNQVSNGGPPKEGGDFDYLQNQPPQVMYDQNQAYGSQMNSQNDPYMSSYYHYNMSFQNMTQDGVNAGGPWSNGEHMAPFLSGGAGYGQMGNDYNMYGGGPFDYQQFGWSFPGGDYNTWGGSGGGGGGGGVNSAPRKDEQGYDAGYYNMGGNPRDGNYSNMNNGDLDRDGGVKAVEQGLKGMGISEKHDHGSSKDSHLGHGHGGHTSHGGHHGGHASSGASSGHGGSNAPKKMTWASVASQPARPQPQLKPKSIPRAPVLPGKHDNVIGTWEGKNNAAKQGGAQAQSRQAWGAPRGRSGAGNIAGPYSSSGTSNAGPSSSVPSTNSNTVPTKEHPVLEKLKATNQYNPKEFNLNPKNSRFFIIKSYSEDDIHRSIKYGIWCSTEHGNKRLDTAFREREGKGPIFLLFSVNGSGHFCGMAQMMSAIDYNSSSSVWMQDKWKGQFEVKWIYVKDVPNSQLRHIRLENNENKPVTNSRDTQEVPPEKGKQVLKIMHHYRHTTSIFDDFSHYEVKQDEDTVPAAPAKPQQEERSSKGDWRGNKGGNNRGHPRDE